MFFAVVFGLAALAAADPEIQQQIQLEQPVQVQQQQIQHELKQQQLFQVVENPTSTPLYKQATDVTPLSESRKLRRYSPLEELRRYAPSLEEMRENFPTPMGSGLRNQRYFPYYEEMKENYPYLPYNYENTMTYPYRSNYFLRYMNKPEMGMQQPNVDYDSQDIYHLHDVNHHHMINNVHEFKQKEITRKLNEMDYPYLPYSPMYYDKYMSKFYNRGYPFVNKYYGKSLEEEYIQPWTNKYYNGYWDTDYIRNYYGNLNSETTRPYAYRYSDKPFLYRKMNSGSEQPISSEDLNIEYTKNAGNFNIENIPMGTMNPLNMGYPYGENQYHKSLEHEFIQPWTNRIRDMDYIRNYYGNFNSDITKPYTYRTLDKPFPYRKVNYVTRGIPESLGMRGVQPFTSRSLNVEHVRPTISTNQMFDHIYPVISKSQGLNYVYPVTSNSQGVDYIHPILDSNEMPLDYIPIEGTFQRNLEAQVGAHAEVNLETPLTALQHNTATNVELSRHTPVVSERHEVVAQELVPKEGRRQGVQVNTNVKAEAALKSEDHISQQPIHRQARDTALQTLVDVPHEYSFYPYIHPYYRTYLPVQSTPLVSRYALHHYLPYYYDLLLRK